MALKQLLVQTNEFLVFDNIDKAVEDLAKLRKQNGMSNAGVLDLFSQERGPLSVGFQKLIDRVAMMLQLTEIKKGENLRTRIDELTSYRNKVVHFSVEIKVQEVSSMLSDILDPLLELLAREIKDEEFIRTCIPKIRQAAKSVQEINQSLAQESEGRVKRLVERFNGQKAPGETFSVDGPITLPRFTMINHSTRRSDTGVDLIGESQDEKWLIEIKLRRTSLNTSSLDALQHYKVRSSATQVWLVIMDEIPASFRERVKQRKILLSSISNIEMLERML